jgi:hypothetical protein
MEATVRTGRRSDQVEDADGGHGGATRGANP